MIGGDHGLEIGQGGAMGGGLFRSRGGVGVIQRFGAC